MTGLDGMFSKQQPVQVPSTLEELEQLAADLKHDFERVKASEEAVPESPNPPIDGSNQRNNRAAATGLKLTRLGELLLRPAIPVDWVLDGRLVAGSVSIVASKPKVGKSTFARNLALAVARGEPFLGLHVKRGAVLYLALEERIEDVAADFRAMGADGSEDIQIADAAQILDVVTILMERRPVLLVIDPLFRLLVVRDEKGYAEMYAALGPLIDVAKKTGTHILCLHHSSKLAKAEPIDAPIGSTALGGAVSTLLVMRRTEGSRTLQTVQRVGQDLSETVLNFDLVSKRLSLGGSREEAEVQNVADKILTCLSAGSLLERDINDEVEGRTCHQRRAIRELVAQGKIVRSGSGKRNNPYRYGKPCSLVPDPMENIGNNKPVCVIPEEQNEGQEKVVTGFHIDMGNKGTRNANDPEEAANVEQKLVPNETRLSQLPEEGGNELFPAEVRI